MKKLMIAAAIVCAAALSQAATVNWSSGTFTDSGLPTSATCAGNATVYFYEITQTQFETWGDDMKKVYENKANFGAAAGSATIKGNGKANVTSGPATSWTAGSDHWVVAIAEMKVGETDYYYVNTMDAHVGEGNNTTTILNYGTNLHGGSGSATQWYSAVPEPTSGLLLLLGVAGLALRRRRA